MKEFLAEHFMSIITFIFGGGSLLGWIFERRKKKTEALQAMQDAYSTFTEDSLKRYEDLKEQVLILKLELENVSNQLKEEKGRYRTLEEKYRVLSNDYQELKTKVDSSN